jgi:hypothetical protein
MAFGQNLGCATSKLALQALIDERFLLVISRAKGV